MFQSRKNAGVLLAQKLEKYRGKSDVLILGIPRGGVVVADVIARQLGLPLDIVVVRKIGAPNNPEFAIGAVGPNKTIFWEKDYIQAAGLQKDVLDVLKSLKQKEREEKETVLRNKKVPLDIKGKTVILVDDGIATGATVIAASKSLKGAKKVILAVPVVSSSTLKDLEAYFDTIVVLESPENFHAVGQFYKSFPQVEDEEVITILNSK